MAPGWTREVAQAIIGSVDRNIGRSLGWATLALATAAVIPAATLLVLNLPTGAGQLAVGGAASLAMGLVYPAVGALLVSRQPKSVTGWLFCSLGLSIAVTMLADEYAMRGLVSAPGSVPGAAFVAWLQAWMAGWWFAAGFPLLFLTFPDGRLPSPRWRPVLALLALLVVIQEAVLILPRRQLTTALQNINLGVANPTGVYDAAIWTEGVGRAIAVALDILFTAVIAACGAALVLRLRHSKGIERQQTKWFAYTGALLVAAVVIALGAQAARLTTLTELAFDFTVLTAALGIPIAAAFAILRYNLYGIDVVISRTVVFGTMAAFITAIYVAIVAGLGSLAGLGTQSNLALSVMATALIAVAFQPVRERVQGLANRFAYGDRASPYEILAQFGQALADAGGVEDVLPRTARVIAEGVGAARTEMWMRIDGQLVPVSAWPRWQGSPPEPVLVQPNERVTFLDVDHSVPVRYRGELMGVLAVTVPAGKDLSPIELNLLNDLAAQAAVVLRNFRLTAALHVRLDDITRQEAELRRSRQRTVAAQDAERRRLERNIHDGAQQHLVALAVKLRLAGSLAHRDAARALRLAAELQAETRQALATLRELTRGIYPPLLAERGLGAALRSQAATMPIEVDVAEHGLGRATSAAEYAVYFCCMEALQNSAKHSAATRVLVRLDTDDRELRFSVSDDGRGFDPQSIRQGSGLRNMRDRAEAVGGQLDIRSARGRGVTVQGSVPMLAAEAMR